MKNKEKQSAFDFKRITFYRSICDSVELKYEKGALTDVKVNPEDQAAFEGVRHHIELFEADLNINYFKKLDHKPKRAFEFKPSKFELLLSVLSPIILGVLCIEAFISVLNDQILPAAIYTTIFQSITFYLVFRNGKR